VTMLREFATHAARKAPAAYVLHCLSCNRAFDFASGESAIVLRHVAYGFGFAHAGACLKDALEQIFVEPGFDCAAYAHDTERIRILGVNTSDGWSAVLPETPERTLSGSPFRFEPLRFWALVEHADGSWRVEGVTWDDEWLDEPGAAEFVEAREGRDAYIGYASPSDREQPARLAQFYAIVSSRYGSTNGFPRRSTRSHNPATLLLAAGL
jgi:hypothetical protein